LKSNRNLKPKNQYAAKVYRGKLKTKKRKGKKGKKRKGNRTQSLVLVENGRRMKSES
jgi:hypothetical protein